MHQPPLVVDLDGTLIHTDMLHETALCALRTNIFSVLRMPLWLAGGKAKLKEQLAHNAPCDVAALPYNQPLLEWLRAQHAAGRRIVLCTASNRTLAERIAQHLGIFTEVFASDGQTNLLGKTKAHLLESTYGAKGFDYAGNAREDLPVWAKARKAILVHTPPAIARQAFAMAEVEREFPPAVTGIALWLRVLRVHQWLKNLLLFGPALAAHLLLQTSFWLPLFLAFSSFCLCASSVYIINDLFDLESDRQHPRKRSRPFASGAVPLWKGAVAVPLLLVASQALALSVGAEFTVWLFIYFCLTTAYTFGLKRIILLDCIVLALLYTLRIIAGAAAIGIDLSFWLLAFSLFLFFSLAYVKRYAELLTASASGKEALHGRGYTTHDVPLVQMFGVASGYAAVVVFALYLHTDNVVALYQLPQVMWCEVPVLLFWIHWVWVQAHRGNMHDDPLVFAVKDRVSILSGCAFLLVTIAGTIGIPW